MSLVVEPFSIVVTFDQRREAFDSKIFSLLQPAVNFSNISQAAFLPILLCQKINTNTYRTYSKAELNTFVQKDAIKMLVKLAPDAYTFNSLAARGMDQTLRSVI